MAKYWIMLPPIEILVCRETHSYASLYSDLTESHMQVLQRRQHFALGIATVHVFSLMDYFNLRGTQIVFSAAAATIEHPLHERLQNSLVGYTLAHTYNT